MEWYWMLMDESKPGQAFYFVAQAKLFGAIYDDTDIPDDPFMKSLPIENWRSHDSYVKSLDPTNDVSLPDVEFLFWGNVCMFSAKLISGLKRSDVARDEIQYLAMRVFHSSGHEEPNVWLVNTLKCLTGALDIERSKYVSFSEDKIDPLTGGPKITVVGRAVLRASVVSTFRGDVFRLAEHPEKMFVSQRFVDFYTAGGYTGAYFSPIELV